MSRRRPNATIAAPGFTLIEVIMAVAIVAVFAAMALPRVSASGRQARAELAARKLAADLAWCRMSARARSTSVSLTFASDGASYTMSGISDAAMPDLTVRLTDAPLFNFPATVSLTLAGTTTATSTITFDPNGIPSAEGTVTLRTGTSSRTVTITSPNAAITVQ